MNGTDHCEVNGEGKIAALYVRLIAAERDRDEARERVKVLDAALQNLRAIMYPPGMRVRVITGKRDVPAIFSGDPPPLPVEDCDVLLYRIDIGVCREMFVRDERCFDIVDTISRGWFRKLIESAGKEGEQGVPMERENAR